MDSVPSCTAHELQGLIMNYAELLRTDKPVRTGLIGAGAFGSDFWRQSRRIPGLEVGAVCDLDVEAVRTLLMAQGADPDALRICDTLPAARQAMATGKLPIVPDGCLLAALDLDVIVEASGSPDAGAAHGLAALEQGTHLVVVNKEMACTVGPVLAHLARRNGLVYTMADGDQPGMVMDMVSWAQTNGLEVVCAGKSSEADHPATGSDPSLWGICSPADSGWPGIVARRSRAIPHARRVRVPDLAEMAIVINESGFGFDKPRLHGPVLHYREMLAVLCARDEGGLLQSIPAVEVVNLLSHPHAPSMAGGVFIVIRAGDRDSWRHLASKGHLMSPDHRHMFLYRPFHLLGLETGLSVLAAALLRVPTAGLEVRHQVDMVCRAERDLARGHVLSMDRGHRIADICPELRAPQPVGDENLIPYYLAAGQTLARDVAGRAYIRYRDVILDETSALWQLRVRQDALMDLR